MALDDKIKEEILRNIALTGAVLPENAEVNPIVMGSRSNINHILNRSGGLPKVRHDVISKFSFILSQPKELIVLNPFEIRCCFCKKVISYPAWYYVKKYNVNHFHFFVCFDKTQPTKPTAKCYKSDGNII